jgi:hypothetical protein
MTMGRTLEHEAFRYVALRSERGDPLIFPCSRTFPLLDPSRLWLLV